jgi:sulfhydrogenase subunit beta (sulfur reductase)
MKKARIKKEDLKVLFEVLAERYRTIGPKAVNGAVVLSEISFADIPAGRTDRQGPGRYRPGAVTTSEVFSFSPGPDSFKKFLHPSSATVFSFRKSPKTVAVETPAEEEWPMAFVGVRACDLAALDLLDKVFLEGPVRERGYNSRRKDIFIAAANCLHPGENCFCDSMGTGPEAKDGFDIAMTEVNGSFLVEAGTAKGEEAIEKVPHEEAGESDLREKKSGYFPV